MYITVSRKAGKKEKQLGFLLSRLIPSSSFQLRAKPLEKIIQKAKKEGVHSICVVKRSGEASALEFLTIDEEGIERWERMRIEVNDVRIDEEYKKVMRRVSFDVAKIIGKDLGRLFGMKEGMNGIKINCTDDEITFTNGRKVLSRLMVRFYE